MEVGDVNMGFDGVSWFLKGGKEKGIVERIGWK